MTEAKKGNDGDLLGEFLLVDDVKLTVGETVFLTTAETLKADSPNKLQTQRVYRDRDPKYVGYILHYLRGHHSFLEAFSPVERLMLLDEAKFYGLNKLATLLEDNNEVKNARKLTDALIPWRFELLRSSRYKKWIEDDTWWTGLVSTLLQFDFFRSIMRSDSQTDSLLTLFNDIVTHVSLAMDRASSSSSSSSSDTENDDQDENSDEEDEDDEGEEDKQPPQMALLRKEDTEEAPPIITRHRRIAAQKKHDTGNDQKQAPVSPPLAPPSQPLPAPKTS